MDPAPNSQNYLRQLFDRTQIAILIANDDGTYVDANVGACQLLGGVKEDIVGRSIADFIRPTVATTVETQWRAFLRDGEQNGMIELRRFDGTYRQAGFYAEANFVPGFHCSFLRPIDVATDKIGGEALTICSWTKQIWHHEKWVSVENFLQEKLHVRLQHGMSPEAYRQFLKAPGSI